MKKILLFFVGLSLSLVTFAQPANYYNSANGLTGNQLKIALHNIIKDHTSISYGQIWNAYWSTDNKGNGVVWDMYSDRPGGTPPYTYYLGQDECGGSYSGEGDCYNREHSWPKSWFNDQSIPRTDLHHIFPTDGFVNGKRSNNPFGEVRSAEWTSINGSKLGSCKTSGYTGTVFEPIDEYKGDFARAIMYMSVRYYGEDSGWSTSDMTNKSEIKSWAINMLLRWNELDPVSQKEIDRNNAIYNDYQHNRNPFVDHPEYARMIWDPNWQGTTYTVTLTAGAGGSISPSGTQTVNSGNNFTFTVVPNVNYVIATVKVNGEAVNLNANNSYTIANIQQNITVNATFVENTGDLCSAPQGLSASVYQNTVNLVWQAVAGATEYEIYRDGAHVAMMANATSWTDRYLSVGEHCYMVIAYCLNGISDPSDIACATVTYYDVEENLNEPVYLFPNPIERGQEMHLSGNQWKFDSVVICDLCGHVMLKAAGKKQGGFAVTIPIDMPRGCYIVRLMKDGEIVKNLKLMVR